MFDFLSDDVSPVKGHWPFRRRLSRGFHVIDCRLMIFTAFWRSEVHLNDDKVVLHCLWCLENKCHRFYEGIDQWRLATWVFLRCNGTTKSLAELQMLLGAPWQAKLFDFLFKKNKYKIIFFIWVYMSFNSTYYILIFFFKYNMLNKLALQKYFLNWMKTEPTASLLNQRQVKFQNFYVYSLLW